MLELYEMHSYNNMAKKKICDCKLSNNYDSPFTHLPPHPEDFKQGL